MRKPEGKERAKKTQTTHKTGDLRAKVCAQVKASGIKRGAIFAVFWHPPLKQLVGLVHAKQKPAEGCALIFPISLPRQCKWRHLNASQIVHCLRFSTVFAETKKHKE